MVRYRELRTIRQLEKELPHQVEIVVPPGGLGRRLDEIEAWLAANVRREDFARWGRRRDGKDVAVWGFTTAQSADGLRKTNCLCCLKENDSPNPLELTTSAVESVS